MKGPCARKKKNRLGSHRDGEAGRVSRRSTFPEGTGESRVVVSVYQKRKKFITVIFTELIGSWRC